MAMTHATEGGKAAALRRALEKAINKVLLRVVSVGESGNYYMGGYLRWGMIEKELVAAVHAAVDTAPAAPEPQGGEAPICQLCKEPDLAVNPVTGVIHRWSDCGSGFGPCPMQKPTPATPGEPDVLLLTAMVWLESEAIDRRWDADMNCYPGEEQNRKRDEAKYIDVILAKLRSRGGETP